MLLAYGIKIYNKMATTFEVSMRPNETRLERLTSAASDARISRLPSFSLLPVSSTAALVLSEPVPSTLRRLSP